MLSGKHGAKPSLLASLKVTEKGLKFSSGLMLIRLF